MKNTLLLITFLQFISCFGIHTVKDYKSLDPSDPIIFEKDHIIYQGKKIVLGPKSFFIDGLLSDAVVSKNAFVYNSINAAVKDLTNGTEASPMTFYIAPYVYWIDNPDDPEIRIPKEGERTPFGLEITCEWLRFQGLSKKAENIVLASNRGQTMGAKGNFTMFKIVGNGTSAENITFGNYCNVDLEYNLKPSLNKKKRGSAIVQAQLAFCIGDKIVARNTHFISRLNLVPFYGGDRTLFDQCHFESTDDALAPKGLYLNCTFDFHSSKPFGHTAGTGAILLNCNIKSLTRGEQYLVKSKGQIAAVDCKMKGELTNYWGWKQKPQTESRYYHYNNSFNNKEVLIGSHHLETSVAMANKQVLNAYRFTYKKQVIYNTYNLLKGEDDWDPMGIKEIVIAAEKQSGTKLTNLPTQLLIPQTRINLETEKDTIRLTTKVNRFGNYELKGEKIKWSIASKYKTLINLIVNKDGSCTIIPTNTNDATKEVIVQAATQSGLEASSVLYVAPKFLNAPKFITLPKITKNRKKGQLSISYKLDMKYADQSLITWYRCTSASGKNPIEVAVSRLGNPKTTYQLTTADIGYYIMASVRPKHLRCNLGTAVFYKMNKKITKKDGVFDSNILKVDLLAMSTKYQSKIVPGFWTVDCFKPEDTNAFKGWKVDSKTDSWFYGYGINGAENHIGLVQNTKGARLRYTPVGKNFADMKMSFTAVPAKTAGQGFSSAKAQYMDICIKFDTEKLNGYALRLVRTTKYHDAIDCILMEYKNGVASPISEAISTSCYRTECFISVELKGNKLIARMETPTEYHITPKQPEVKLKIALEAEVSPNGFGGIGFQHTGTVRSGATLIKDLKIEW